MSHRITTKTQITNRAAAEAALKAKDWKYSASETRIDITSGPMARTHIDLRTGEVVGDTDWSSRDSLESLNQPYAEEQLRIKVQETGGYFEERTELADGSIRIVAYTA